MYVVVFSRPANLCNWKYEARFIFYYFTVVLMQLNKGFYVQQDKCCVTNARNLKVKATKTQYCKLLNMKNFQVIQRKKYEIFKS